MSKAEEKADKAYPINRGSGIDRVISMVNRKNGYIQGYMQAEKDLADAFQAEYAKELARTDLALTIEDIELLHTFLHIIKNNKHRGFIAFTRLSDEQYDEVLHRFHEMTAK